MMVYTHPLFSLKIAFRLVSNGPTFEIGSESIRTYGQSKIASQNERVIYTIFYVVNCDELQSNMNANSAK
jgi:hypothetical protein